MEPRSRANPGRPYSGETATDRAEARRKRLLDAAHVLIARDGWREVSIRSLCDEAQLNKRYFYESFTDLDALAAALVDDLASELLRLAMDGAMEAAREGKSTAELAHAVLRALIEFLTDHPHRARVLFTEVAGNAQAIAHRRSAVAGFAQALASYGYDHHEAKGATDPLAPLTASVLIGGTIDAILGWLDGQIPMSRDDFVDDVSALWVIAGDGAAARAKARRRPST